MHNKGVGAVRQRCDGSSLGYPSPGWGRRSVRFVSRTLAYSRAFLTTRRITTTVALGVGLALTGATALPAALAGTYVMRSCNVPGHKNVLMHPWETTDTQREGGSIADACATGGGIGFTITGPVPGSSEWEIRLVKPGGDRSRITFVKLVLWYAARLTGSGQPLNFYTYDLHSDGSYHYGLSDAPPGSENVVAEQLLTPDTKMVSVAIRCGPVTGPYVRDPGCVPADGVPLLIRGMEVTLREELPPIVLQPGGTLLDVGPQSGVRTLTYAASDAQSGLSKIDVLLGETLVASRDLTPQCPQSDFTVCPASDDGTFEIDTRSVANGHHPLTVRVWDAAGNAAVVHGDMPVEVANSPAMAAPPTTGTQYALSARLEGTSRSTLIVPYGRRVSVSGRLTQDSEPVPAGAVVDLLEKPDGRGAREVRRARLKTKAGGSFSVVLAATRPSRRVRLAYRPGGATLVVSRSLRVRVRSASRVRASLRGRIVRFSGRVLSGPIPKGGKRILMEGRATGSAWTAFKSLRTGRNGHFSGTYRLRVHRPGVTLKIRALVRSEGGYGYLSSRSRAVTLRVR